MVYKGKRPGVVSVYSITICPMFKATNPCSLCIDFGLWLAEVPLFLVKKGCEALPGNCKKVKELLSPKLLMCHDVSQKVF